MQYIGGDFFEVDIGTIKGAFRLCDLQDLLDEIQALDEHNYPIANRVLDDGQLEKERDTAFDVGYVEGKGDCKEEKEDLDECCG